MLQISCQNGFSFGSCEKADFSAQKEDEEGYFGLHPIALIS
jgi:hypothetical protein